MTEEISIIRPCLNILLVEDDSIICDRLKEQLTSFFEEKFQITIEQSHSSEGAEKLIAEKVFSLAIVDVMHPSTDDQWNTIQENEKNIDACVAFMMRNKKHKTSDEYKMKSEERRTLLSDSSKLTDPEAGLSLVRKWRKSDRTKDLPVLFFTAVGDEESINNGIMIGPDGRIAWLVKPSPLDDIINSISGLLGVES